MVLLHTSNEHWETKILQNTKPSTQYLGRSASNPNYVFGIQSWQRSRFWLGHTQGVKVLALVIAPPAVDLTVLSQGQAVGGACSYINHLLPWEERGMQIQVHAYDFCCDKDIYFRPLRSEGI